MKGDAQVSEGSLAGQVRSSARTLTCEWRSALEATPWSAELAADAHDDIGERHLPGLLEMITRQIERPSAELAAVYRDEMCRYELQLRPAPEQEMVARRRQATAVDLIATQRAAFENIMVDPERALVLSLLDDLNGPLLAAGSAIQASALLLGDCMMNEIRCFLADRARRSGVAVRGYHQYFSGTLSVPFDVEFVRHFADRQKVDFVGLSPFTFDGLPLFRELLIRVESNPINEKSVDVILEVVHAIVSDLQSVVDAPILLHNACGAPIGRDRARLTSLPPLTRRGRAAIDVLNAELARRSANWSRVISVDEVSVARRLGLRRACESAIPGGAIPGALFHTSRLGRELAELYWEFVDIQRQLTHIRAVAVDLDGTLWSGVMAEGRVGHYVERQVLLAELARCGLVLIALSKGSPASLRWDETRIDQRDFAAIHRGWGLKEDGLRLVMRELGIRSEHVAVIDDSPAERELLGTAFPGLTTLDPDDPGTWRRLGQLRAVIGAGVTDEARRRAERYRAHQARHQFVAGDCGVEERMRRLGLTLTFGRMTAADVPRAMELLRRTNQFNTTGFTSTRSGLLQLAQAGADHDAFVAHLKDRFGDFGLVAVVIVRRDDRLIESFVMSCRAMGYGVEQVILNRVISQFGVPLSARLVHTRLNEPCHGLYPSAGFTEQQPGVWQLAAEPDIRLPGWFEVRDNS